MNILKQKIVLFAPAVALLLSAPSAQAVQLEEILVTAQKREQNLQDVPISITALSTDMLSQRGVTTLDDLGRAAPGVVISNQLHASAPIIRGVGQANVAPGAELGVAVYLDGVYLSNASNTNLGLGNIERLEVLRGPQGTLFGRNATGGLLHIITQNPEQEFGGNASLTVSDPETVQANVYLTGGVSDKVSASIAALVTEQSEGYGKNIATGSDTYMRDESMLRGKLLFDISDDTSLLLTADRSELTTDFGLSKRFLDADEAFRPDGRLNPSGYWDTDNLKDPYAENEQWGISAVLEHEFENFDSKLVAAYREYDVDIVLEQSWTHLQIVDFVAIQQEETFTLEGQLTSNESSPFEWIAGFYYLDSTPQNKPVTALINNDTQRFVAGGEIDSESIAVFGQATFELSDKANLTLGLRWTEDEKELTSNAVFTAVGVLPGGGNFNQVLGPSTDSDSWSELTYRASLDYDFNDNILGYLSYNRGFKAGTYNLNALPITTGPAVAPEFVDTIEVGIKGDFMDGRLRVNGALYHNDYTDIQLQSVLTGVAVLVNAAEATTYGGELEVSFLATDELQLYLNAGYVNAEYDDFPGAVVFTINQGFALCSPLTNPVACQGTINAEGNKFENIPELTLNVGAIFERELSSGTVGFSANYFWADERTYGFDNSRTVDAYGVLTADVFYRFGDEGQHEIRMFGRNIADEEYTSLYQLNAISALDNPNPGRSIGVKYSVDF